ncbi:MAG: SAM-dependent methyltransferase [Candidatus Rokuibacteriota bacterium]|nr:MAG: SAM-dependent methyltransferase [Candidatus Rokubacteria bacterium]
MSLYAKYLLPRLIDLAMSSKATTAERTRLIPLASGVVLEIGAGSALNLPFYGPGVRKLYALDPSQELWRLGRGRVRNAPFPIEFLRSSAESIPVPWTLCTIPDPTAALAEMRRVLKPQGTLVFIEHGWSPDPRVRAWQERLNPLWKRVAGGCNLDRQIEQLIGRAGFQISTLERGYGEGLKPFVYLYRGLARPANQT